MLIIPYKGVTPRIDKSAYIAESSSLIGDVAIGSNSSVWFNTVLRGNVESIKIGNNTNVQDGSVIHASRFNGPVEIGDNITIGHLSLIHACTMKNWRRLSTFYVSRVYKESLNALTVFLSKNAIVIGPMPPGTGVIYCTLD